MTARRCALYMIAAVLYNLDEVWVSPQPILLFMYIAQCVACARPSHAPPPCTGSSLGYLPLHGPAALTLLAAAVRLTRVT